MGRESDDYGQEWGRYCDRSFDKIVHYEGGKMYKIIEILKRPDGVSMEANWTPHFPVLLPVVSL